MQKKILLGQRGWVTLLALVGKKGKKRPGSGTVEREKGGCRGKKGR